MRRRETGRKRKRERKKKEERKKRRDAVQHGGGSAPVVSRWGDPPFGFSPPYKPLATRAAIHTPSEPLVLLDFDRAGAEEAAEHGGTLLAI